MPSGMLPSRSKHGNWVAKAADQFVGRQAGRPDRASKDQANKQTTKQIHEVETMFSSFTNKYLKKKQDGSEATGAKADQQKKMPAACPDPEGCCSAPNCLGLSIVSTNSRHAASIAAAPTTTTTRASRSNFVKTTTSSVFPSTQFTNPESLPPLSHALSTFTQAYPHYNDTQQADDIRRHHYPHLSNHVCLDYTGFTLFSRSQSQPSFTVSYKSASLTSQVQYGSPGSGMESAIRNRIMRFLNLSREDYTVVFTANRTSAFKLLAEAYPFHRNKRLLTVYDYESEAVCAVAESAQKRGSKVMSAEFSWPGLRIRSARLKGDLEGKKKRKKKKRKGLFVFPLQSRMTGARYPYLWMRMAHQNGWDVVLDACALGPKDLDTLGLSLIQPNFVVCSFFKVFGEDPSGFAALLIKKSSSSVLESSMVARSIGVVSIAPTADDFSGTFSDVDTASSFSGPLKKNTAVAGDIDLPSSSTSQPCASSSMAEENELERTTAASEIVELESSNLISTARTEPTGVEIECMGLDHADSLGLLLISSRLRYITNWLVLALAKLRHPNSENGHPLVTIYGPRIKFERGPAISFNVCDWKGEKVEPALVQKLADRSNISLSCGFLRNIWFSDKYAVERDGVLERRRICPASDKGKEEIDVGISVVNVSLGFLANFEDAYKLWAFVARFLDADFVEKERWRYLALNQKMIEV